MHPGRSAAVMGPSLDQVLVAQRALLMMCVRLCVRCTGWAYVHTAASGKTGMSFLLHAKRWLSTMDFVRQGFVKALKCQQLQSPFNILF